MSKYEITVENPSYELEIEDDTVKILQIAEQGPAGAAVQLSNATPQPLGTAAPGVSTQAMRGDAVIQMPTAAQVGAASTGALATETARAEAAEAATLTAAQTEADDDAGGGGYCARCRRHHHDCWTRECGG
jgi:hypothetical protein